MSIIMAREFSPTKAVSIRQYLGQCAIRLHSMDLGHVDSSFSADLRPEKVAPKALVFSDFLTSRPTPWFPRHNDAQHY